jgi:phosphoribosylformylglycinamidine synthase
MLDLEIEKAVQKTCLQANKLGLLTSAHDTAEGGLAVTLAESCMAGKTGAEIKLKAFTAELRLDTALFSESQSRIIVTIKEKDLTQLVKLAGENKVNYEVLGKVGGQSLKIEIDGQKALELSIKELGNAYFGSIPKIMNSLD